MKMQKRILSLALALSMCLALAVPALAAGDFVIKDGVLTEYNGQGGDVAVPNGVKTIGSGAFKRKAEITGITIPDTVTKIEGGAFFGCTGLTTIYIPASVTELGNFLFHRCLSLTEIKVDPANSAYTDVDGVLYTKDMTDMIECPPGKTGICTIPAGVACITDSAFRDCAGLTAVELPDSVTKIELLAFQDCTGLTSLTIPNSVTTIGNTAFDGCTGLTEIHIPASVTGMGNCPFRGCASLARITADPASRAYADIDGVLFNKDRSGLVAYPAGRGTTYAIPDSTRSIGSFAFSGCTALTGVTIPASVATIGDSAFDGCTSLTAFTVDPANSSYEDIDGVLYSKDGKTLAACPGGRTGAYKVLDGVTSIRTSAFSACSALTEVILPESVTTIGELAFDGCTGLTAFTMSGGIQRIDPYAFQDCKALADVYYSGSQTDWGRVEVRYGNSYLVGSKNVTGAAIHFDTPNTAKDEPVPSAPTTPTTPSAPAQSATAAPTAAPVLVNGETTAFDAYEINENNYFKLRDLAYVLNGTDKQFEVTWDAAANAIVLTSGKAYTAVGGEMSSKGAGNQTAEPTTSKILLDGKEVALTAYEIGGNNYFKLRDIGAAFDFGVDWDAAAGTIRIDTSKGYTPN